MEVNYPRLKPGVPLGRFSMDATGTGADLLKRPVESYFQRLKQAEEEAARKPPGPAPRDGYRPRRGLIPLEGFAIVQDPGEPPMELGEARAYVQQQVDEYLDLEYPSHILLIRAPAGFGKTRMLVRTAERLCMTRKWRVFYAGPRHDFYQDLMNEAEHPAWWYEWLPRQTGDEERGVSETCHWEPQISTWMSRGHEGLEFCKRICGWDYINHECPYHAQRNRHEPIIYGMHQHVWLGHPLMETCRVLIGDEYPVNTSTVLNQWSIPAAFIVPSDIDLDIHAAALPVLQRMRALAESGGRFEGKDLLEFLGGAQAVLAAFEEARKIPLDVPMEPPWLRHPEDADLVPYSHFLPLAHLIGREAETAATGEPYLTRVIITGGELRLLLRREPHESVPRHVIWLDATGNEHLYQAAFRRPVKTVEVPVKRAGRVFQVWDRSNNKSALLDSNTGEQTHRVSQLRQQIDHIVRERGYRSERVGVITFKDVKGMFEDFLTGHFGANRGTNEFNQVEALFVGGTPQPDLKSLVTIAKMLWHERTRPFQEHWSDRDVQYAGQPWAYPKSGFWADPDLNAVLWQHREAEIIQSVNRARILTRPVDVWLLANLPIWELQPDEIVSLRELFDVPPVELVERVLGKRARPFDPHKWAEFIEAARGLAEKNGNVIQREIMEATGLSDKTVKEYWRVLKVIGWEVDRSEQALRPGRGRPPEALKPGN